MWEVYSVGVDLIGADLVRIDLLGISHSCICVRNEARYSLVKTFTHILYVPSFYSHPSLKLGRPVSNSLPLSWARLS